MATQKFHLLQYNEHWEPGAHTGMSFGIKRVLFSEQSEYQHVQVMETDVCGRLLTLDGLVMLTERDEFVYHEMIAHPALCLLPDPKRVLVVGGGDGGTVREILRHPGVEQVDLVEIDGVVIEASKRYLPTIACAFDDPRLRVHVQDGIAFVKEADPGTYDLVIVDSTDPVGFAEGLFGEAFYRDCARVMTDGGLLAAQTESPFDRSFRETIQDAHGVLNRVFKSAHVYLASIPTYPTGLWSFSMATKGLHPVRDFDPERAAHRLADFGADLRYYNPDVHRAAFALPNFVRTLLEG